jgi:CDP-diacylglycerol--glycerol-3-phosphate 3-phosphatidyltransferase
MASNLNVPNFLSAIRIIGVVPTAYYLWIQENEIAVILGIILVITDLADGYIARKYNLITNLGKILDPLADKLLAGAVIIILSIQGRIPEWYIALVLGKDLVLLLGGLYAARKLKFVIPSNKAGKYAAFVTGIALMFAILNMEFWTDIIIGISTFLIIFSFVSYVMGGIKKMKEAKIEADDFSEISNEK